jgi:methylmalonyl-CoA mutase N-terminal domain/subunit
VQISTDPYQDKQGRPRHLALVRDTRTAGPAWQQRDVEAQVADLALHALARAVVGCASIHPPAGSRADRKQLFSLLPGGAL